MRLKNLLWLCACLVSVAGVAVLLGLRSYQMFTREELAAVVRCEPLSKARAQKEFFLEVTQIRRGVPATAQRFQMRGDQWTVGGEILKWHPWLTLLGLRSCHKLTRVGSRYLKAADEAGGAAWAYDLNGGTDSLWLWLYRCGRWLPFVEAVYGNATYQLAQPGSRWGVYVTLSGYMTKPLRSSSQGKRP